MLQKSIRRSVCTYCQGLHVGHPSTSGVSCSCRYLTIPRTSPFATIMKIGTKESGGKCDKATQTLADLKRSLEDKGERQHHHLCDLQLSKFRLQLV